jgi:hypothetical protein
LHDLVTIGSDTSSACEEVGHERSLLQSESFYLPLMDLAGGFGGV